MREDDPEPRVSVVVPVLNDAPALARLLSVLAPHVGAGLEIVVVDGGSADDPHAAIAGYTARLLSSPPGRGRQLATGIDAARGPWLWLLHADSDALDAALGYLIGCGDEPAWGRFDIRFAPPGVALSVIAAMMNVRSRLTGVCTGDQGIFLHRTLLAAAGGMPVQPLMEDVELCRRLKRHSRPRCRSETVITSSRRWQQRGVLRTVIAMWWFRLRYALGADPRQLARDYYR